MIKEITMKEINEMIDKNNKDREYCNRVTAEMKEHGYLKSIPEANFLARMVAEDRHAPGMVIQYPYGTVLQQEKHSYYYRGENALFGSSKPSIHRNAPDNPVDKIVYYFIAEMKIYEFQKLISRFDVVKKWPFDVLYRAIAQHYGIPTDWLDVTNDFEVALFFACCKYDTETNDYRPLREADFKEEKDTYGVLFKADSFIADLIYGSTEGKSGIMPIGFQPFMRCHRQYGYAYVLGEDEDLYKSETFQMMKFKHSIEFSEKVYNDMDEGNKIFPREGLNSIQDEINQINKATTFSKEAFETAYRLLNMDKHNIDIMRELQIKGIDIGASPVKLSRQRIRNIDRKYKGIDFSKECALPPHSRLVYLPPSSEEIYLSLGHKEQFKK
ncbi:MAG: FRG domain-containing protein [Tissierellia bacterium]|nr:FRG domain-containing protein [Tissierellia bacterium]